MVMFDPNHDPAKHIVTARLSLSPSEALQEELEPLYRPSIAASRLGHLALRSNIGVPLEALPGQRFWYENPRHPGRNAIGEFEQYRLQHVRPLIGRQLPLLSHLNVLRSSRDGTMRLKFQFGLNADEQQHLGKLHEFRALQQIPILEAHADIQSQDIVPNEVILRGAVEGLRSALGLNHPARERVPPARRFVDDEYYAVIDSRQLTFRLGK